MNRTELLRFAATGIPVAAMAQPPQREQRPIRRAEVAAGVKTQYTEADKQ